MSLVCCCPVFYTPIYLYCLSNSYFLFSCCYLSSLQLQTIYNHIISHKAFNTYYFYKILFLQFSYGFMVSIHLYITHFYAPVFCPCKQTSRFLYTTLFISIIFFNLRVLAAAPDNLNN